MYGVGGERRLTEASLEHLEGYRGRDPYERATPRPTSCSWTLMERCSS